MTFAFLQGAADATDTNVYTFAAQNLGVADGARYIIVGIASRIASGSPTIDSVTVGGVTATLVLQHLNTNSGTTRAGLFIAAVPTGTSGDVVVTLSATMLRCAIQLWRAVGINSPTPTDTDQSTDADPACALNVPAGGFAIGVAAVGSGTGSFTWTGITENYDAATEAFTASAASLEFASEQIGLSIIANSASSVAPVGVFASWGPAAVGAGKPWNYYAQAG